MFFRRSIVVILCIYRGFAVGVRVKIRGSPQADRDSSICQGDASTTGEWVSEIRFMTRSGCEAPAWPTAEVLRDTFTDKRIYIAGDSQSMLLHKVIHKYLDNTIGDNTPVRNHDGRDPLRLKEFYQLESSAPSEHDNDGVGPVENGRINPGTTDCRGCGSTYTLFWELGLHIVKHVMEFAKDTELSSTQYEYTQEVIFQSFARRYPADIVFWNTGVHDMKAGDADSFEANLRWAVDLIMSSSGKTHLLYWSSLPPRSDTPNVQTRELALEFNKRAAKVMGEFERAHYFSVFDLGDGEIGRSKHNGNIHMNEEVYRKIAVMLITAAVELLA